LTTFADFNLDEQLLKALEQSGYKTPTPVQERAIPKVLEGHDLIVSAQTGTGKTAAFLLPILHCLKTPPVEKQNGPRLLVLVPTRELALQITTASEKYSKYLPLKTVCVYGGVPYPLQKRMLSKKYDILVATPGRLIDHLENGLIDLSALEFLVLDEADRMLDMGFIEAVDRIAEETPSTRKTLLFSATLDKKIKHLSKNLQKDPFEIQMKTDKTVQDNIEERLYYTDGLDHKLALIDHLLDDSNVSQAIVFTSTIQSTEDLSDHLIEKGIRSAALNGDMNQRRRTFTIDKLRKGRIQVLVATDVAARGIDVANLSHVINLDLPFQSEDYIHRIGRTGRAGASGIAITFARYRDKEKLSRIERLTGKPFTIHTVEGLEPQKERPSGPSRKRGSSFKKRSGPSSFGGDRKKSEGSSFGSARKKEGDFSFGGNRKKSEDSSFGSARKKEGDFSFGGNRKKSEDSSFGSTRKKEGVFSFGGNRKKSEGSSFGSTRKKEGDFSFGGNRKKNEGSSFSSTRKKEGDFSFGGNRKKSEGSSFGSTRKKEGDFSFGDKRKTAGKPAFKKSGKKAANASFGEKGKKSGPFSFGNERKKSGPPSFAKKGKKAKRF
jgi:superfamily II DNA/RNA helicase